MTEAVTSVTTSVTPSPSREATPAPWWRHAVVYQVYPRSFADGNGDGVGDLRGLIDHLDHIADLGADAIWLSPIMVSPQADHGYDVADYRDVDPLFGSLADLDELVAAAHARGLRVTMDFVPNHTSSDHAWFREALAAGPGSDARARYHFRDGRGDDGEYPPNNWASVFGGPAWSRVVEPDGSEGQWYLHLFAPEQPDLNWHHPDVLPEFVDVLRFWLDRGIDGFRMDVADALMKHPDLPDTDDGSPLIGKDDASGVHEIFRAFRRLLDSYDGERMAVIETGADPDVVALFLRPDEMNLAFNFAFTRAGWNPGELRTAIDESLAVNADVGAATTWVVDNHDTARSVTRYGVPFRLVGSYLPGLSGASLADQVDVELGTRRHRAMALLLLALPGTVYLYNGQELGLPNVEDLPEEALQDPIWERSGHTERGRDGCRIPMPWSGETVPYGFSSTSDTWLPMPDDWAGYTVATQADDSASMLALYTRALRLRRERGLGTDDAGLTWVPEAHPGLLAFTAADTGIAINPNDVPMPLPTAWLDGQLLVTSDADLGGAGGATAAAGAASSGEVPAELAPDTAVWVALPAASR